MQELHSQLDSSINWVQDTDVGKFESRYVRRLGKDVVYISSQSGCNHGCRMCHLTSTKQTKFRNATVDEMLEQAARIVYGINKTQRRLHFNFMARGEPLDNPNLLGQWDKLSIRLMRLRDYEQKHILISSILPKQIDQEELRCLLGGVKPRLYYSAYSADANFRRKWLPRAHTLGKGVELLRFWHDMGGTYRIHFCYIEGENDSEQATKDLCEVVKFYKLTPDFNIVRYNSPGDEYGKEPDISVINRNVSYIQRQFQSSRIKVIPRVGADVYASCGTFVNDA
jgi:adenine C2-methylase RlmN of 23S rRNA A2503 and tRNA A37